MKVIWRTTGSRLPMFIKETHLLQAFLVCSNHWDGFVIGRMDSDWELPGFGVKMIPENEDGTWTWALFKSKIFQTLFVWVPCYFVGGVHGACFVFFPDRGQQNFYASNISKSITKKNTEKAQNQATWDSCCCFFGVESRGLLVFLPQSWKWNMRPRKHQFSPKGPFSTSMIMGESATNKNPN